MLRPGSWLRLAGVAISVVLMAGAGYALPPVMTTVSDTVYRADGSAASGTMLISWPAFTTADAKPVAAGTPLPGNVGTSAVPSQVSFVHNTVALTGWSGNHSGLVEWFDQQYDATISATLADFFSGVTIRDNISSGAFAIVSGSGIGSNFLSNVSGGSVNGPLSQGLAIYGCSGHDGVTGCNYSVKKNLVLQGIIAGEHNNTPDLNLLGSNTVEACSCTTAANGGTCTPGSPNTWTTPVTTGSKDACDRSVAGYGMRTEFERTGVWPHMLQGIAVETYTHKGDPLKIDCGYRPNGELKLFHAVPLASDVNAAKVLAFSYPKIAEGIREELNASTRLTAVVEDNLDIENEALAFAYAILEESGIQIVGVGQMGQVAELARKELKL